MDRHIGITTDETLCPALLFGVSGTKHLSEQRLQGRNHSFALRQVPNDYKGYGLSKELARRTIVERIATETKHIILHYSACPLRTTARGRRLSFSGLSAHRKIYRHRRPCCCLKRYSVLYRTTAAPRQSANSCKHDLTLYSACAFFDRLEQKRKKIRTFCDKCLAVKKKLRTFVPTESTTLLA